MNREAWYRIDNPRFSASRSRAGADSLAADLCRIVERNADADPQEIAKVLRAKAAADVEDSRKFVERAALSHKRNNGWAIAAMCCARGYLIAARAVEKAGDARALRSVFETMTPWRDSDAVLPLDPTRYRK